jgi:hypothetical protein
LRQYIPVEERTENDSLAVFIPVELAVFLEKSAIRFDFRERLERLTAGIVELVIGVVGHTSVTL